MKLEEYLNEIQQTHKITELDAIEERVMEDDQINLRAMDEIIVSICNRGIAIEKEVKEQQKQSDDLQTLLFLATKKAYDYYLDAVREDPDYSSSELQRQRFCALYGLIETAGLEYAYQEWKEKL